MARLVAKRGKKYRSGGAHRRRTPVSTPDEGVSLVKKVSTTTFDGTVELHMRLGVDPRHADQVVRGVVVFFRTDRQAPRIMAFAQGEKAARPRRPAPTPSVGTTSLNEFRRVDGL